MLSTTDKIYLDDIRDELTQGSSGSVDQIPPLVQQFDTILKRLQTLADDQNNPNSIKIFNHLLFIGLQRDIELFLKVAPVAEHAEKADTIVKMYKRTILQEAMPEEMDKPKQHASV